MRCPGCGWNDHKDFAFYYAYIGGQGDYPTIRCTLCGWSKVLSIDSYNLLITRMKGEEARNESLPILPEPEHCVSPGADQAGARPARLPLALL